jgi:putative phosphoesterase
VRIGIISDTHGLLRPEALEALRGVDRILHAGDIGNEGVLATLRAVAPLVTVRGNNDHGPWADALPTKIAEPLGDGLLVMVHDVSAVGALPPKTRVVVAGHSHKPQATEKGGVLWLNPGSAGPRRFSLPVTIAYLDVDGGELTPHIVHVLGAPPPELPDDVPDARDGLTRRERVVLTTLAKLQKKRRGRHVPLPQLYGEVVEQVDMSMQELQAIVERLGGRR